MAIIFNCAALDILAIFTTLIIGIITYFKWTYGYWKRRNLPYVEPSIPFGTLSSPLTKPKAFGEQLKEQYDEFKGKGHKHVGLYAIISPAYMPLDPEYIKCIMQKDFNYFVDRGVYFNEKDDPLSAHLFSIEGTKWRNLRAKLTPTFTSGKMKMMFQTFVDCSDQLSQAVNNLCLTKQPANIKDILGRYTTNVIGSCAFGLDCNSFEDPNSEFTTNAKRIFNPTKFEQLKGFIGFSSPNLGRLFGLTLTPKEASDFFRRVVKETIDYREKNNYVRKDFMQLLIELKNNVTIGDDKEDAHLHDGKTLTIDELSAQAFIFFLAGFETSSTTMTFCLFELALHQVIQEKVRDEVDSVLKKHDGKISYEAIMEMKYLGQVVDETLRKYPPLPSLNRKCLKDYQLPGTDTIIEKGTNVIIPVIGLHRDAEYFPDPEVFDPDRFSDNNKSKIIPFTYLPFGEGPRNCIGLRFGLLQSKVGLAVLLTKYRFTLNKKTQVPLKLEPFSFILAVLGDIWLNVTKI